jgi:hypothetical protein
MTCHATEPLRRECNTGMDSPDSALYFVALDQGVTSVFGSGAHVHEFMHDARHLLGFACH